MSTPSDKMREDALHAAVCQAVALMNVSPEVARSKEGREAHNILREALIAYADATLPAPAPAAQAVEAPVWPCPACGIDRARVACPKGYTAALTGQCPMVCQAQLAPRRAGRSTAGARSAAVAAHRDGAEGWDGCAGCAGDMARQAVQHGEIQRQKPAPILGSD